MAFQKSASGVQQQNTVVSNHGSGTYTNQLVDLPRPQRPLTFVVLCKIAHQNMFVWKCYERVSVCAAVCVMSIMIEHVLFKWSTVYSLPYQFVVKYPLHLYVNLAQKNPFWKQRTCFYWFRQTRLQIKCKILKSDGKSVRLKYKVIFVNFAKPLGKCSRLISK